MATDDRGIPTSDDQRKQPRSETTQELAAKSKRTLPRNDLMWNDAAFRERVARFAAERGRTAPEVCRAAGLSRDYMLKQAGIAGRSIEALLRLAHELGVSLPELLGETKPASKENDEALERLLIVAEVASHLYLALAARPASGDTTRTEILNAVLEIIERRVNRAAIPDASESAP